MIELTCVSCGLTESIQNLIEAKRSRTCKGCGQPMIEFRQPGSALPAEPHVR